jgi:hypothetical protein
MNFNRNIRGFLDPKFCDLLIESYDHLGIKKISEIEGLDLVLSAINRNILEKIVSYSRETKFLHISGDTDSIGEHLRFVHQCCYGYRGIKISTPQSCITLSPIQNLIFQESSDPILIKIEDEDFRIERHHQDPGTILDFVIYLGGGNSEIAYERMNLKYNPDPGDLLISPSIWTHNFKVSNTGKGFYLLYRIASDPTKYQIIDF